MKEYVNNNSNNFNFFSVGMDCVYKEIKKIKSMRNVFEYKKQNNEHTYGKIDEPSQTV